MTLPAEVGMMVLPESVLFPAALKADRLFAVGLARVRKQRPTQHRNGRPDVAGKPANRGCGTRSAGARHNTAYGNQRADLKVISPSA